MKRMIKIFLIVLVITSTTLLNPISLSYHNFPQTTQEIEKTSLSDGGSNSDSIVLTGTGVNILYYNQTDEKWGNKIYGADDTIAVYGCGPTTLAMLVSSLTDEKIQPDKMAAWAFENGYFCENSGSYHTIISEAPTKWGLKVIPVSDYSIDNIYRLLSSGNLVVVLMGNGHFTKNSGHFILLRGVSLDGEILIADPVSMENSQKPWDPQIILNEAKYNCGNNGPMWAISS